MYFWSITFAVLQLHYYVCVQTHREGLSGENIEKLVYLLNNDHGERTETKDIEASRRSVIDKNFMRFGRSDIKTTDTFDDGNAKILKRTAHENFMRFGRPSGGNSNFMRFGRSNNEDATKLAIAIRPSRYGNKDENFIRFGKRDSNSDYSNQLYDEDEIETEIEEYIKSKPRFKRSTTDVDYLEKKRNNNNFMRFGRNSNFIRFGRNKEEIRNEPKGLLLPIDKTKCSIFNFNSCFQNKFPLQYQQFPMWMSALKPINFDGKSNKKINENSNSMHHLE